ncbi:hypothetical protein ACFXPA_48600 [Amycolatopsis sp. NPDC059090]|uniref:hypothetical protein n=1 Tax=unclassified Amycolatopsis TaxID=2618356 RepID=UPI00366DFD81
MAQSRVAKYVSPRRCAVAGDEEFVFGARRCIVHELDDPWRGFVAAVLVGDGVGRPVRVDQ